MGSSICNILVISQRLSCVVVLILLLSSCGNPEDPVVEATGNAPAPESFGVAYLKRPADALTINANQATNFPEALDVANDEGLTPGNVFFKDLSSGESTEVNITQLLTAQEGNFSAGDVSDLEVSYDGRYLIFSVHEGMQQNTQDRLQPNKWNIWLYDADNGDLFPLMEDDDAGLGNDIDPHFLPDGRIVFSSDRQTTVSDSIFALYLLGIEARPLNESGNIEFRNTSYALHIFDPSIDPNDPDEDQIKQISFSPSNDLNPTVLSNGKILFSRWDNVGGRSELNLYTINPDGTELDIYYGAHSHNNDGGQTEHYAEFKQMPDGTLIGTYTQLNASRERNQMVLIDHENFSEYNVKRFTSPSLSTTGHTTAIATPFLEDDSFVSLQGSYSSPFPIFEPGHMDRLLVAWDACRVMETASGVLESCDSNNTLDNSGYELAEPLYSVLIYELDSESSVWQVRPEEGLAIVNPVALINRPITERPTIIPNKTAPDELDTNLNLRGMGAISIKSVYDTIGNVAMEDRPLQPFNRGGILTAAESAQFPPRVTIQMDAVTGNVVTNPADPNVVPVDRLVADIPAIRLSTDTNTADQRVARFIRISKAVPRIFDETQPQNMQRLSDNDFGNSNNYEMREILGYSVVEPDGSVFVEVPAMVPFTIDILDANGRSFMSHTNWMQVMPGEVKVCGGCHSPNDGQAPINIGATTPGPFPNTVGSMTAEVGETMAEARARLDCMGACTYQRLKRDIEYDDPWTDAILAGRAPDASFSMVYDASVVSPIQGHPDCETINWYWSPDGNCRIAINYVDHIQPIFDTNCIGCHNDDDPAVVPPGNLVLERQIDAANSPRLQALRDARTNPNRIASYEFLFINRPQMEFDSVTGGRRFVVTRDPGTGQPITTVTIDGVDVVVTVGETDIENLDFIDERPPLVRPGVARARQSSLLYVLTGAPLVSGTQIATPTLDHTTLLTDAEKRLLTEWIDNGTQYYNGLSAALVP